MVRRPVRPLATLLCGLLAATAGWGQAEAPTTGEPAASATTTTAAPTVGVVVAIDSSRSLRPRDLDATAQAVSGILAALPVDTPTGLLAFADEPRWVVPAGSSPAAVRAALGGLAPEGNFTLLHDALFAAARALPDGGVVLLATDGRDENSATTIEDVGRLCAGNHVRILAVGNGPRLDDRALRRLAWLSDGRYLGPVAGLDLGSGASALDEARAAIVQRAAERAAFAEAAARQLREPTPAAPPPSPPAIATPPPAAPAGTGFLDSWLLPLLILLALMAAAAGVLGALLWRNRRRKASGRVCETCFSDLPPGVDDCPNCAADRLAETLRGIEPAAAGSARPMRADTAIFKVPFEQAVEHTYVMQSEHVLEVREPGAEVRAYRLPAERAFTVGRDSKINALAVADPTLSSRHFRVVPQNGGYYLLDEGSTNGTYVNGERVKVKILRPGDMLHAGQVDFAIRLEQQRTR